VRRSNLRKAADAPEVRNLGGARQPEKEARLRAAGRNP